MTWPGPSTSLVSVCANLPRPHCSPLHLPPPSPHMYFVRTLTIVAGCNRLWMRYFNCRNNNVINTQRDTGIFVFEVRQTFLVFQYMYIIIIFHYKLRYRTKYMIINLINCLIKLNIVHSMYVNWYQLDQTVSEWLILFDINHSSSIKPIFWFTMTHWTAGLFTLFLLCNVLQYIGNIACLS